MEIPIVNIASSNWNAPTELLDAASKYGFVFVENIDEYGIRHEDISHLFNLSKQFFASPTDIKEEVAISSNKAGKNHGWLSRGIEKLDPATQKRADVKEALNIGEHVNGQLQQPMPTTLKSHIDDVIAFQDSCHRFCQSIFECLATALDIDKDWFTIRHDRSKGPSGTVLRLLYYPHVQDYEQGVDIRAGAHSDFGSITLLFQQHGQPGLEIKTPSGEWAPVSVDPRQKATSATSDESKDHGKALPILVNIGDLLEDWTGGLLKSTVHRVIFPTGGSQEDRYSIAYFCHPLDEAELESVPSKIVRERASRTGKGSARNGKVLTAKDHLMERLSATYSIK